MCEQSPSSHRYGVVALLVSLFAITYLDRVCISVAGPRIQRELHIGPVGWGWVTGIFTLAYCIFEIPTGALGDRIGPRRVLTRVVLWWSLFTVLTGTVTSFLPLLLVRFLFGAGEAGAFPNASVVVSRWFSRRQQATMMGVVLMASQLGGALAPLLVIPIQMRFGWRASFYAFGALGVAWSTVWYMWFRDSPEAKLGLAVPEEEAVARAPAKHTLPWTTAMRSQSVLAVISLCFCYVYVYNFFQTWFHTFLEKGRGVSESGLLLTALPFALGGLANLGGGAASDSLVRRLGLKNGRRLLGVAALATAGVFTLAAMVTKEQVLTVIFLTLVYGAISFQQTIAFGACLDIGQEYAGAMVGLFNTIGQVGGLLGAVAYGYIVQHTGSYNAPFVPMIVLLFVGSLIWLKLDASKALTTAAAE
jgi:MFS family permease